MSLEEVANRDAFLENKGKTHEGRLVFNRFFDLRGNLGMLKKNRLEKLVSPVKRSA